ncbi:hypothetical protein [Paraburkholderia tropica]|uniref:hypothetical protein n=1 Tax=Paraburkholderia tropica TaxID=92647 RepID=UPI0007ED7965|nr:hypothetical protein [Paraburkholderia tropica]OBR54811.1 hypothetical protein A6456_35875 [Paraburkholderia tropica]
MGISIGKASLVLALSACLFGISVTVVAQPDASTPAPADVASAAKPLTKAEQRKQARAQRKAARKEARAKNVAELNKLKSAGYVAGSGRDLNYPENIQKAQEKASAGAAASQ